MTDNGKSLRRFILGIIIPIILITSPFWLFYLSPLSRGSSNTGLGIALTLFFAGVPIAIFLILASMLVATKKRLTDLKLSKVLLLAFPVPLISCLNLAFGHAISDRNLGWLKSPSLWISLFALGILLFMSSDEEKIKNEKPFFRFIRVITDTSARVGRKNFIIYSSGLLIILLLSSMRSLPILLLNFHSNIFLIPFLHAFFIFGFLDLPALIALSIIVVRRLNELEKSSKLATPLFLLALPLTPFPVYNQYLSLIPLGALGISVLLILWLMSVSSEKTQGVVAS